MYVILCSSFYSQITLPVQKIVGLYSGGMDAAFTLPVVCVVIYGAYLAIKGYMTTGALTSFILYSLQGTALNALSLYHNSKSENLLKSGPKFGTNSLLTLLHTRIQHVIVAHHFWCL